MSRWHPDGFSTQWLETALKIDGDSLLKFSAVPIGTGQMSLSFRMHLDWKMRKGPATVVAKCSSSDAATRMTAKSMRSYSLELGWYRELAHSSKVSAPRCLHAESSARDEEFVLLLEDLSPATQGDQLAGASVQQVAAAIDQAARLHAPYWNAADLDAINWLQPVPAVDAAVRQMVAPLFAKLKERYRDRLEASVLEFADAFVRKRESYFDRTPVARTIQHRDLRLDNILFSPDQRRVYIVDWQTIGIGAGGSDIAYLIGTSIADPHERALHERELVLGYTRALQALGVTVSFDAIWEDYRANAFAGLVMAIIASMSVVRTPRGDEMFAVMAERSVRQAQHLDSLDLL